MLVHQAFSKKPSQQWLIGITLIFSANLILLLLPIIRGYVTLGRADVLEHIGSIKEIIYTAHFSSSNVYPAIHILAAEMSLLTGVTPELLAELIPILFYMFYIFSVFLLAKTISFHRGQVLLIVAFGSVLLFGRANEMLAPSIQCFFLLPFILLLFLKVQISPHRSSYFLMLVILLLVTPFLHPGEGTLFLILVFLCFSFTILFHKRDKYVKLINSSYYLKQVYVFYVCSILLIVWIAWFSCTSSFSGATMYIWDWLIYAAGKTTAMAYSDLIVEANLSVFGFIRLFLNMFGQAAIYCSVGLVIIIGLLKRLLFNKTRVAFQQFNFSILFIAFGALMFVAFFSNLIWVSYNREMRYVIFAATILNGLGLHSLFHRKHRRIGMAFIAILLIVASTFGAFNTFASPIVREANYQVTHMEVAGAMWFFDHQHPSLLIDSLSINQLCFANLVQGHQNISNNIRYAASPPVHFGYYENATYGESLTTDKYFIDSKLSRISGPSIFPEYVDLWDFTPDDFYRLDNHDPSVNLIYSNSEFWAYYIRCINNIS